MSGSSELDITPATKDGFFTPPHRLPNLPTPRGRRNGDSPPPPPPPGGSGGAGSDGDLNKKKDTVRNRSVTPPRGVTPRKGLNAPLHKQKESLPKLALPDNWNTAPAHLIRQKFEEWVAHTGLAMATWHDEGHNWWKKVVKEARDEHENWVAMTESEKAQYEQKFMWGQEIEIPLAPHELLLILCLL